MAAEEAATEYDSFFGHTPVPTTTTSEATNDKLSKTSSETDTGNDENFQLGYDKKEEEEPEGHQMSYDDLFGKKKEEPAKEELVRPARRDSVLNLIESILGGRKAASKSVTISSEAIKDGAPQADTKTPLPLGRRRSSYFRAGFGRMASSAKVVPDGALVPKPTDGEQEVGGRRKSIAQNAAAAATNAASLPISLSHTAFRALMGKNEARLIDTLAKARREATAARGMVERQLTVVTQVHKNAKAILDERSAKQAEVLEAARMQCVEAAKAMLADGEAMESIHSLRLINQPAPRTALIARCAGALLDVAEQKRLEEVANEQAEIEARSRRISFTSAAGGFTSECDKRANDRRLSKEVHSSGEENADGAEGAEETSKTKQRDDGEDAVCNTAAMRAAAAAAAAAATAPDTATRRNSFSSRPHGFNMRQRRVSYTSFTKKKKATATLPSFEHSVALLHGRRAETAAARLAEFDVRLIQNQPDVAIVVASCCNFAIGITDETCAKYAASGQPLLCHNEKSGTKSAHRLRATVIVHPAEAAANSTAATREAGDGDDHSDGHAPAAAPAKEQAEEKNKTEKSKEKKKHATVGRRLSSESSSERYLAAQEAAEAAEGGDGPDSGSSSTTPELHRADNSFSGKRTRRTSKDLTDVNSLVDSSAHGGSHKKERRHSASNVEGDPHKRERRHSAINAEAIPKVESLTPEQMEQLIDAEVKAQITLDDAFGSTPGAGWLFKWVAHTLASVCHMVELERLDRPQIETAEKELASATEEMYQLTKDLKKRTKAEREAEAAWIQEEAKLRLTAKMNANQVAPAPSEGISPEGANKAQEVQGSFKTAATAASA